MKNREQDPVTKMYSDAKAIADEMMHIATGLFREFFPQANWAEMEARSCRHIRSSWDESYIPSPDAWKACDRAFLVSQYALSAAAAMKCHLISLEILCFRLAHTCYHGDMPAIEDKAKKHFNVIHLAKFEIEARRKDVQAEAALAEAQQRKEGDIDKYIENVNTARERADEARKKRLEMELEVASVL